VPKALLALLVVAVLAPAGHATFMMPEPVPVDRITTNLAKRVEDNPGDAEAHLRLGLAHAHAFFNNNGFVATDPQQDRAGSSACGSSRRPRAMSPVSAAMSRATLRSSAK